VSDTRVELPQRGQALRGRRLQRGLELDDAARQLGLPAKSLRALEWDRPDLLPDAGELDRRYAAFLGLDGGPPAAEVAAAPSAARPARPGLWVPLAAVLAPALVTAIVLGVGYWDSDGLGSDEPPLLALMVGLIIFSSLLLAGAVLPPDAVARAHVPPASFARYRQPLVLSAIGILVPITLFAVLILLL
jgi:hypothetical protein